MARAMPPAIRIGWGVSSSTNHLTPSANATINQITRLTAPRSICARSRASESLTGRGSHQRAKAKRRTGLAVVFPNGVKAVDRDDFGDAGGAVCDAAGDCVAVTRSEL